MRHIDGHINNGKTRTAFSHGLRHFNSPKHFFKLLLPPHFLRRDNGAVWLSPIATNLFASSPTALQKQINPLQSLSHFFGFFKPSFAITNLTQFVFARDRQKQNQLNLLTHKIGVLCTLFAHLAPLSQKRKPQAYGIF